MEHRYELQKGSKKLECPECGKRTFVPYIDTETNEIIKSIVGRCDREVNCGYHVKPKQFFQDNGIVKEFQIYTRTKKPEPCTSFIDKDIFIKSLAGYEGNNFVKFLLTAFDPEIVNGLISKYFIGSSTHWPGSTTFWQVDNAGKIRTGKIMLYSPSTGRRVKEPFNHITWAQKALNLQNFNLKQCLFGEHLLSDTSKPVAIVESEKSAIIASVYLPQFIWLACGSLQNLSDERCKVLTGRNVVLYPDLNGFEKWNIKAKEMNFKISNVLEMNTSEDDKKNGFDIADYLLKTTPDSSLNKSSSKNYISEIPQTFTISATPEGEKHATKKLWDLAFDFSALNDTPIKLSPWELITNPREYVKSHLQVCEHNNGNRTFLPYLNRLKKLEQAINN